MSGPLTGKVALVAGATRGAGRGTAVALGEAGATLYCTGRTTGKRRSEYDRPETIEWNTPVWEHALDGSQPDCWRYMVEVQDAGRPPDPTGYR